MVPPSVDILGLGPAGAPSAYIVLSSGAARCVSYSNISGSDTSTASTDKPRSRRQASWILCSADVANDATDMSAAAVRVSTDAMSATDASAYNNRRAAPPSSSGSGRG